MDQTRGGRGSLPIFHRQREHLVGRGILSGVQPGGERKCAVVFGGWVSLGYIILSLFVHILNLILSYKLNLELALIKVYVAFCRVAFTLQYFIGFSKIYFCYILLLCC